MMLKNFIARYKIGIVLILIILLAAFLRLYNLTAVPPSLSRDEVSIGYNAYSILKTGKDEYGKLLPLAFEAFGDWKLPLDIYFVVPFVAIFGLTSLAVRLPVALFGIASVVLIFFLAEELRKKLFNGGLSVWYCVLAAFFLAVSPWHIYMSRIAFGHDVIALFFFLLGLWFFLKSSERQVNLIFATLSFCVTLFVYTSYHIFLPVLLLGLFFFFRKEILKNSYFKKSLVIIILVFVVSQIGLWKADATKVAGSSVIGDANMIYYRVEKKINEHHNLNTLFVRALHNKYLAYPYQITLNYLSAFSPEFLFDKGGANPINNLEEMGNLYILDAFLIVLGLYFLIKNKEKAGQLLIIWLLLSPVPGAFTRDAPHSTRTFAMTGALVLIEAYGILCFLHFIKTSFWLVQNPSKKDSGVALLPRMTVIAICLVCVLLYAFGVILFLENFFYHFSLNRARFWNYGVKEAVEISKRQNPNSVVMSKIYDSPYIYFLFFNQYDPALYQSQAQRASLTWDGFRPVKGFDKYEFVEGFDWVHVWDKPDTLYIDAVENIPKNYPVNGWIRYPFGDKAYGWFITRGNPCSLVYPTAELKPKICR